MDNFDVLRGNKQEVFEEENLEKRKIIDEIIHSHQILIEQWHNGAIDTQMCMAQLQPALHDEASHPVARMSAFEHLLQLNEREGEENKEITEMLLETMLSEPNEELQMAQLGIFGSRVCDTLVLKNFEAIPNEVKKQFANTTQALVHEIRNDPRVSAEIRDFAALPISPQRNENILWQKMEYMARLYHGDVTQLWPTYEELRKTEEHKPQELFEREIFIPALKGRRLLGEGKACSLEKELQALTQERAGGVDKGKKIPLRVYLGTLREDGTFDGVSIPSLYAHTYIAELRAINISRKPVSEKEELRKDLIHEWKQRILDELPQRDRELFQTSGDLSLRVETLFDENGLERILKARFNVTMLDRSIDPEGKIQDIIEKVIADTEIPDAEKLKKIEESL